ncbi:MAG: BatA domain-containing protein [Pirellulales bacterium]|nr:BatA domain-containing protein [Pirellulales bacterium]
MFTFLHWPLLWGLALAGVPVLIHLINLLRHRRVAWAAMEFLLASQKKNRTWILLKQLLLLLLRMAAVVAAVLAVAQPLARNELGALLGGTKTHHIILLDDSYSMTDRWADTSAWDEARRVVERIGATAAARIEPQMVTILRFSRAGADGRGTLPDMLDTNVDSEFPRRLADALAKIGPSETAAEPGRALATIEQLVDPSEDESRTVYVLSDFRARQWDRPEAIRAQLAALAAQGASLQLIDCVDAARPNLGIVDLVPVAGTRAAGVPMRMEVTVANHGDGPARAVAVVLEEDGHARPAVKIESVPSRGTAKERFAVRFAEAGAHRVTARLPSDAVAADNARYHALDLPADVPVLLIDGSPEAADARYLSAALAPGAPAQTGIRARIETPRFLSLNPLEGYAVIYLTNVERLDESALEAIAQYVSDGGGLAIFLGPLCRAGVLNAQWYRQGQGILPMPVTGPAELLVDRVEKVPDLDVGDHAVFRVFAGEQNSFLSMVNVDQYFAVPNDWRPSPGSATRVIGRLRNGAPLAVERNVGQGRVIAFTTTAAPVWNNWARDNPSFVVAIQELQSHLARRPAVEEDRVVGSPLVLALDAARYQPAVRVAPPRGDVAPVPAGDAVAGPDGKLQVVLPDVDQAGFHEIHLTTTDGQNERRTYAVNVDPNEGDLARVDGRGLATRLEGVRYDYRQASGFQGEDREPGGYNLGDAMLYLLIAILVGEQILAYSCSYHPRVRSAAGGPGGGP